MIYNFFVGILNTVCGMLVYPNGTSQLPGFTVGGVFLTYLFTCLAVAVVLHVFMAIGLFVMARRRNFKCAFLAWFPVINTLLMGKLVGEINLFGLRIKRIGIIALAVEVLALSAIVWQDSHFIALLGECWNSEITSSLQNSIYGDVDYNQQGEIINAVIGKMDLITVSLNYIASNLVALVLSFLNEVVGFVLLLYLFRNYAPKSSFLFAVLSLFIPVLGSILVFAIRKNSCEEYRDYMRMKMHSMYGGGNPYQYGDGTYRDPFDLSKSGDKGQEKPQSPFEEYEDKK